MKFLYLSAYYYHDLPKYRRRSVFVRPWESKCHSRLLLVGHGTHFMYIQHNYLTMPQYTDIFNTTKKTYLHLIHI